jgi:hypothetical protein
VNNTFVGGLASWIYPWPSPPPSPAIDPERDAIVVAGGGGSGGAGSRTGTWVVDGPLRGNGGAGGGPLGEDGQSSLARNTTSGATSLLTGGSGAPSKAPGTTEAGAGGSGGTNATGICSPPDTAIMSHGGGCAFDQRFPSFGSGGGHNAHHVPGRGATGGDGSAGGGQGGVSIPSNHGAGGGGGGNYAVSQRILGGSAQPLQVLHFQGAGRRPGNYNDPDRMLTGQACSANPPTPEQPCSPGTLCGPGVGRDGTVRPPDENSEGGLLVVRFGLESCGPPNPQLLTTITSCRLIDTRNTPGAAPIANGESQIVQVRGLCGVPSLATAVVINATAVNPPASGDLRVVPGPACGGTGETSTINYKTLATRANNSILRLDGNGQLLVKAFLESTERLHYIIDVNGYFMP